MKCYCIDQFGFDHLTLTQRADPVAGPGQVLARLRAVSLNYRDLLMVQGHYDPKLEKGRVPCSDGAGEVVAVGSGVKSVKVGDRVAGNFFANWIDGPLTSAKMRGAMGGDIDGMLCELVVLNEHAVVQLPRHLSFAEGATLPCAAVTAFNALFGGPSQMANASPLPGETIVVQGTGGVSIFALQLARAAGLTVIVTSSSDEKLSRAQKMGAAIGVNYKSVPDWEKPVRDFTSGGADLIVEVGGAGTLNRSVKAVRAGGTIALIGVLSGVKGEIDTVSLLMRAINLRGIYVGSTAMFVAMTKLISAHQLRPVIDRTFAFSEAAAAMRYMSTGAHFGKVVIEV